MLAVSAKLCRGQTAFSERCLHLDTGTSVEGALITATKGCAANCNKGNPECKAQILFCEGRNTGNGLPKLAG